MLEVVLALALFVAAATIVTGGFNASMASLDRLRYNAHAENLAVSVLSEIQMGVRPLENLGPEPFEPPFEAWTWEVAVAVVDTSETNPLQQVEIIIRQTDQEITHRLQQWVPVPPAPLEGESIAPEVWPSANDMGLPSLD